MALGQADKPTHCLQRQEGETARLDVCPEEIALLIPQERVYYGQLPTYRGVATTQQVNIMNMLKLLVDSPLILTECAVAERLRRMEGVELHPTLFNTPLIYDPHGARQMTDIYAQYRTIAMEACLPILLCAPTWRVDRNRIRESGLGEGLNRDAVQFMRNLQQTWQHPDSPVLIGGLIGPKNDCYSPWLALGADEAVAYHGWQIEELVQAGVDCIITQTIPAFSEALGMAQALGRSGLPYLISFVINRRGEVLDGTALPEAISRIDSLVSIPPAGYMVNCAYPTFIGAEAQPAELFQRLIGIQANASSKDHDQLDGAADLQQDTLSDWGECMLRLNRSFGMKILGGCCGTDDSYLRYLTGP